MPEEVLSDEALRRRTRELVAAAARLSSDLLLQTEKLNLAIDMFNRQYVSPIQEELGADGDDLT